jgi:hypothetical protein
MGVCRRCNHPGGILRNGATAACRRYFASISHSRAAVLSIPNRSSRALLVLASDYLFAAVFAIPGGLTFRELFRRRSSRCSGRPDIRAYLCSLKDREEVEAWQVRHL